MPKDMNITINGEPTIQRFYTQEELDKAVQGERDVCAELCFAIRGRQLDDAYSDALEDCAEAIRKRGVNDNRS